MISDHLADSEMQSSGNRRSTFAPTQQDSSEEGYGSDTTQVQPDQQEYWKHPDEKHDQHSQEKAVERIRTRTIILELIQEVESSRKKAEFAEIEQHESVGLVQILH